MDPCACHSKQIQRVIDNLGRVMGCGHVDSTVHD